MHVLVHRNSAKTLSFLEVDIFRAICFGARRCCSSHNSVVGKSSVEQWIGKGQLR
jgi:hypothetical protein